MAHTNQTPNYELSQFLGTDKPAWLIDYNGDMEKIDLGIKAAQDVADAAKAEADQGAIDIAAVTITANSADAKAAGAVSDFADSYDSTSTYNVGDYVIYNNILYRCITAITVPESFDGAHWARTTVEEIITQINNDLSSIVNELDGHVTTDGTYTTIYNEQIVYNKIMAHAYINVDFVQIGEPGYWLMIVPNSAKPTIAQRVVGIHTTTHKPYMFNIRTDGKIENLEALAQGNYYFDITWII